MGSEYLVAYIVILIMILHPIVVIPLLWILDVISKKRKEHDRENDIKRKLAVKNKEFLNSEIKKSFAI
jgi:hypothetical protein